ERAFRNALTALKGQAARAPASAPCRFELARTHTLLGDLLGKVGRTVEAEDNHRSALGLLDRLLEEDPENPEYRLARAHGHRNLYIVLLTKGKRPEAAAAHRTAVALMEALSEDFPSVPDYRYELGEVLLWSSTNGQRAGRNQAIEQQLRRAVDL